MRRTLQQRLRILKLFVFTTRYDKSDRPLAWWRKAWAAWLNPRLLLRSAPLVPDTHWLMKHDASATACGIDNPERELRSIFPERVTCASCKSAITGYQCGRADERAKSPVPEKWQPISTAPKDGTPILAWKRGSIQPVVVYWIERLSGWQNGHMEQRDLTHWQPLPLPPNAQENHQ